MYFKTRLGDYGGLANNGTSGTSSNETSTKTKSKKHFHKKKKNYGGSTIPVHIGYGYPYNTTYGYRTHYGPPRYGYRDPLTYRRSREPRLVYLDRKSNSSGIHMPTLLISLGVLIMLLLVNG